MNKKLKIQAPPDQPWVGLIDALTWIAFDHSFSLAELLSPNRPAKGAMREIHSELQGAWEKLADCASEGRIILRGKRRCERRKIKEREERCLSTDDLRNCRHLSWPKEGEGSRKVRVEWFKDHSVTEEILHAHSDRPSNEEAIRRFFALDNSGTTPDGWSEDFARASEHEGFDYVDVVVARSGLMKAWPVRGKRRRASLAVENTAEEWLDKELAVRPAATNRKDDILKVLEEMGLAAAQRDRVWKKVVLKHPEWHQKRGRPKKG